LVRTEAPRGSLLHDRFAAALTKLNATHQKGTNEAHQNETVMFLSFPVFLDNRVVLLVQCLVGRTLPETLG